MIDEFSSVYEEFKQEMFHRVKQLKQNDVLSFPNVNLTDIERSDVGAMVTDNLFGELEKLIEEAVAGGAKLLVGGSRNSKFKGHYFQPTLLVDVLPTVS